MSINDLGLVPSHLAAASLTDRELVLPYRDALQAIDHLVAGGHAVFCWEGWLRYPDGSHGHSARHQGMMEITRGPDEGFAAFARRAAEAVRSTLTKSQEEWNKNPEVPNATLYFCLSVERSAKSRG
jgi:hypothetical protein